MLNADLQNLAFDIQHSTFSIDTQAASVFTSLLIRKREPSGLSRRSVRLIARGAALHLFARLGLWLLGLLLRRILTLLLTDTVLLSHLSLRSLGGTSYRLQGRSRQPGAQFYDASPAAGETGAAPARSIVNPSSLIGNR
jgi:hypothetical protein